jgi:serine/threonine protein kinase
VDEVVFGRYRLLSLIGQGGMGKVYRAHDTVIGRDVAVKVLPTELGSEPGYRARFKREAHTAARLTEPHIVPIFDTGEIDGQLYLVMPIIEGTDVQAVLQREGPMNPPRAVHVIEQLGAALDVAHAAGLVHRDIKPSNALLTARDFVYLIDFGIAHDGSATRLTSTGMMVGTLAYMAPERFTDGHADARSDVYALACVLHECLTGTQPYPGDSLEQQIAGHLTLDPPRPSATRPELPAGLDQVIAIGMAKTPDTRYQSGHELATAARQALSTTPERARSTGPRLNPTRPVPPPVRAPRPVPQRTTAPVPGPATPPPPAPRPFVGPPAPIPKPRRRTGLVVGLAVAAVVAVAVVALVTFHLLQPHSPATQGPAAQPASPSEPSAATGGPEPAPSSRPPAPTSQYFKTTWGTICQVTAQQVSCQACIPGQVITNAYTCTDPAPSRQVTAQGAYSGDAPGINPPSGAQPLSSGQTYHANGWTIAPTGGWARFTNDSTGHGMAVAPQNYDSF